MASGRLEGDPRLAEGALREPELRPGPRCKVVASPWRRGRGRWRARCDEHASRHGVKGVLADHPAALLHEVREGLSALLSFIAFMDVWIFVRAELETRPGGLSRKAAGLGVLGGLPADH
jgi:hypothetical protein